MARLILLRRNLHSLLPVLAWTCYILIGQNPAIALLPVLAQSEPVPSLETVPPPVLPPPEPQPEAEPLPPLEEILPSPILPRQPALEVPQTITVRQFAVLGNTVFSPEELAEVLEPYTNRPISFAELLAAQTAVTQLYIERGYITSGAFIPPQTLRDGVVRIETVEGEVESITITGLKRLNSSYVRRRLAQAVETPLNRDRLLRALQLLQLDPLIANLSAELAAGVRPGTSILEVNVVEADSLAVQLSIDNYRSPSVGTIRRQVEIEQANLLGFGDRFRVGYINTDGSDSLDNLSYTIPLNSDNSSLSFSHYRTDSDIIEEPFDFFEIHSEVRRYELIYRQPLYQTPNQELAIGFSLTRDATKVEFFDPLREEITPFPAQGAGDDGEIIVSALRFAQEYTNRDTKQVFALRSEINWGIDLFNATNNDNAPDSQFLSWRGLAQYLRLLSPETTLILRTELQLSNDSLVLTEQFSVGGQSSVRGYRQNALIADNGWFASAEIRTPILQIRDWQTTLQLTPFVDFGTLWHSDQLELENDTLYSVGIGLRLLIGDNFTARFDWGIPLVDLDNEARNTLQENGIYLRLQYTPF